MGVKRSNIWHLLSFPLIEIEDDDGQMKFDRSGFGVGVQLNGIEQKRITEGLEALQERHDGASGSGSFELHGSQFRCGRTATGLAQGPELAAAAGGGLLNRSAGFGHNRAPRAEAQGK